MVRGELPGLLMCLCPSTYSWPACPRRAYRGGACRNTYRR